MTKFIVLFLGASIVAAPYANADTPALRLLKETAPLTSDIYEFTEPFFKNAPSLRHLDWINSLQVFYVDGGALFSHDGRNYSVRLVFTRGEYDPYIKNYRPIAGVIISDITEPGNFRTSEMRSLTELTETAGKFNGKIKFNYWRDILRVWDISGNHIKDFKYIDLLSSWRTNGTKYATEYRGTKIYLIPQCYWTGTRFKHGYVLSQHGPTHPDSGLPLDFAELFTSPEPTAYKPIAYSIPLAISFKHLGAQGKPGSWSIQDLTENDLMDALADELE